ncbi:MAG: hypothetical protein AAGF90_13585 [Pseudomonadota bacterium]
MLFQETFLSLWYWIFVILFWGVICNYTFGVPNELLMRARRSEDEGDLFDRYARRNLAMFGRAIRRRAAIAAAVAAFVVAALGTLAFWRGQEQAMGVFVVVAPLAALWLWGGRMIAKLDAERPDPERLRRAFMFERRLTGVVAGLSMVAAIFAATARHGPGWTEALFRGF